MWMEVDDFIYVLHSYNRSIYFIIYSTYTSRMCIPSTTHNTLLNYSEFESWHPVFPSPSVFLHLKQYDA